MRRENKAKRSAIAIGANHNLRGPAIVVRAIEWRRPASQWKGLARQRLAMNFTAPCLALAHRRAVRARPPEQAQTSMRSSRSFRRSSRARGRIDIAGRININRIEKSPTRNRHPLPSITDTHARQAFSRKQQPKRTLGAPISRATCHVARGPRMTCPAAVLPRVLELKPWRGRRAPGRFLFRPKMKCNLGRWGRVKCAFENCSSNVNRVDRSISD